MPQTDYITTGWFGGPILQFVTSKGAPSYADGWHEKLAKNIGLLFQDAADAFLKRKPPVTTDHTMTMGWKDGQQCLVNANPWGEAEAPVKAVDEATAKKQKAARAFWRKADHVAHSVVIFGAVAATHVALLLAASHALTARTAAPTPASPSIDALIADAHNGIETAEQGVAGLQDLRMGEAFQLMKKVQDNPKTAAALSPNTLRMMAIAQSGGDHPQAVERAMRDIASDLMTAKGLKKADHVRAETGALRAAVNISQAYKMDDPESMRIADNYYAMKEAYKKTLKVTYNF